MEIDVANHIEVRVTDDLRQFDLAQRIVLAGQRPTDEPMPQRVRREGGDRLHADLAPRAVEAPESLGEAAVDEVGVVLEGTAGCSGERITAA